MAGRCTPPLNFVANGSAGSAFPAPLDPTDLPAPETNPGFGDMASSYLDALDPTTDGSDQIASDAAAAVDALELTGTAMATTLDSILLLLDQAQPQPMDDALGAFAGAQPGAEGFVGDAAGVAVPALGMVPLELPGGGASITFGGPPESGGVARAGAPAYTLHLPVQPAGPNVRSVKPTNLGGPNPPFLGISGVQLEADAAGVQHWTLLVGINPAAAGTFTGVAYFDVDLTITGISGTVPRQLPFQVVIQ